MSEFPTKTYTVASTGHTYDYIRIQASAPSKSTIAFFHGFPAVASGWRHQIKHFVDQGYGIIAPNALGYGGSSKPESPSEYRSRLAIAAFAEILDHENIDTCHGVGHDFGCLFLSRLYNYHPKRLLSLTFISVPYNAPGVPFDLEAVNQLTKKMIGFEKFGYIQFLITDRAPGLIEQHLASFQSLAYHKDVITKADNFYPPGKLEAWLEADRNDHNVLTNSEESAAWYDAFSKGGFRGPLNWYHGMSGNINQEEEKADLASGKMISKINVPVLVVDAKPDKSSIPGFMEGSTKQYAEQVTVKTVETQGHYPHITSKEEVNQAIGDLISGVDS
ncbi:hypothetical protein LTR84_005467 [Exophiala bonariae]|uniref:AB hydrolase-1 domain-containing protein n=1 Tax=Exophiala bonariae TaxID=1690606 RepID=A0AAV9N4P5_9EURO|nr:hypothetical protein LTR84_005467 [Exophiala bonariae]